MMLPAGYQMRLGTPADFAAVRAFYHQLIDDRKLAQQMCWRFATDSGYVVVVVS